MRTEKSQVTLSTKAKEIYKKLMSTSTNPQGLLIQAMQPPGNVWRSAWAFDTLSDYCSIFDSIEASNLASKMISEGLNPASQGNWWDDFGWIAIGGLRASQMEIYNQSERVSFFKNAMNAWCYMYGSAWNSSSQPNPPTPQNFIVPFPDVVGWTTFLNNKSNSDIGAPNVYNYAFSQNSNMEIFKPKFSTGGGWNSPLTNISENPQQSDLMNPCGTKAYLNPIQNTVTNGLFAIISNRVFVALSSGLWDSLIGKEIQKDNKKHIMQNAFVSAINQITWFSDWFANTTNGFNATLRYQLNNGSLIRERAPIFANNTWDAAFCNKLSWMGDQGLVLASLRESVKLKDNAQPGWLTKKQLTEIEYATALCPDLIKAAHYYGVSKLEGQTTTTPFYRPWVQVEVTKPSDEQKTYGPFPEGDDGDYDTGIGVLCRYLLQAYDVDPGLLKPYKTLISSMATAIVNGDLATYSQFSCNGLIPDNSTGSNAVTPWINQLAILCLAERMQAIE